MPLSEWKKFISVRMPLAQWNRLIADLTARAEADDAEAQWELGAWLDGGLLDRSGESFAIKPNPKAAIRWFRRSAQAGDASGQIWLANYLSEGRATERDDDEAILWLKRAVRQNYWSAANNIACVYKSKQNHRRAFFWYQRAASMGDDDALVEVGVRFYEATAYGVIRNRRLAISARRFEAATSLNPDAKWPCLGWAEPIVKVAVYGNRTPKLWSYC
ncbi:MAG: tetratricopeptide repeat protein [Acidobacteriota bacterium]